MIERQLESTASALSPRSVTDLLQDTATHTENVVRGEIRLAVLRVQENLTSKVSRVAFVAVSGVLALVAFVVLLVAGIMRLSYVVEPWLATAIGGAVVGVVALLFLLLSSRNAGASS
jgi:hypothetical protein